MHNGTYGSIPNDRSRIHELASVGARMRRLHSKGALAVCKVLAFRNITGEE
jgi:hypothetical protein